MWGVGKGKRVVIRDWKYPSKHVFAFWNGVIPTAKYNTNVQNIKSTL